MMIEAIITLMLFLAIYVSKIILYALFGIQLHALCIHICLVYHLSNLTIGTISLSFFFENFSISNFPQ